jgi:predicted RNA-binding Zn-ribbon protein involved in translation (DUF1610 family)
MNISWWGSSIICPKCEVQGRLKDFKFSADGEILFDYKCPKCDKDFIWRIFASQLQTIARCNDLEKHCKKCAKGVTVPPLALPAPAPTKPKDDFEDFMKGLGA